MMIRSVATCLLVLLLLVVGVRATHSSPTCLATERLWGEWCVYTGTDDQADKVVLGFDNIYHASVWARGTTLNMVIGGWRTPAVEQSWRDRLYHLITTDPNGVTGWALVPGASGSSFLVGQDWETAESWNKPAEICRYDAVHSVQPHVLAAAEHPGGIGCCDVLYYAYDATGMFPESKVGVHWAYFDPSGALVRAGGPGQVKNPLLDWRAYDLLPPPTVVAVSDARGMYDPDTNRFYLVYAEWLNAPNPYGNQAVTSLAWTSWSNLPYTVVARDLGGGAFLGSPQIVRGPSGSYVLFYTQFLPGGRSEIRARTAATIVGPYIADRLVLSVPVGQAFDGVSTPTVMCNPTKNVWQIYFAGKSSGLNNHQIYTGFLRGVPCTQDPLR